jgi:hypothetical protein
MMHYYNNNISPGLSSRALLLRSMLLSKPISVAPTTTATTPHPRIVVPGQRRSSSSVLGLRHFHTTNPRTSTTTVPFMKKHCLSHVVSIDDDDDDDDDDSASSTTHETTKFERHDATATIDDSQNPAGKRQRRQAAATLVQNFPSWTGVGKKSKAQPRPAVHIPPRGIGPVEEPNQNDVLVSLFGVV